MSDIIFYVENDRTTREAFASYFRRKKYEVHIFGTAPDAEEMLATTKPHVIISDQKLGGDSLGWEFLKRSIALSPSSIRLILSGYSESHMILHSFRDGVVFDYISKSASNEEIEAKIRSACDFWKTLNLTSENINTENLQANLAILTKEISSLRQQLAVKDQKIIQLTNDLEKSQKGEANS